MPGVDGAALRPRRALPARTLQLLREHAPLGRTDQHAYAIILSMVNHGHTEEDAYGLLIDEAHKGGHALQHRHKRNPAKARRWLHREWINAVNRVTAFPAVGDEREVVADLARVGHAVEDRTDLWRGPGGASRLAVVSGLLYFAYKAKNPVFRCSDRQLAQHLNMRQATVNKAIQWHLDVGVFVERVSLGAGLYASTYRLHYGGTVQGRISSSSPPERRGTDTPLTAPVHDVFAHAGLMFNATRILSLLPPAPARASRGGRRASPEGDGVRAPGASEGRNNACDVQDVAAHVPGLCTTRSARCRCRGVVRVASGNGMSVHDLAEASGLSIQTVRRHVDRMATFGLIAADPTGSLMALPFDADQLAMELGVSGRSRASAARFAGDRQAWLRREAKKRGADAVEDDLGEHIVDRLTGEVLQSRTVAVAQQRLRTSGSHTGSQAH